MIGITIDDRLLSAAEYVRQGAHLADIGTDHAHLPIFLLLGGRISSAVLADINEGPLAAARENVEEHGLSDRVEYRLTDGCAALCDLGITDYTICGMGGELIADIIDRAPHLTEEGIRLILQPMSRQATLRRYLAEHGFSPLSERYTFAQGKYYVTMLVEYSGICQDVTDVRAELGYAPEVLGKTAHLGYLEGKLRSYLREKNGKTAGGAYQGELDSVILATEEKIREYKGE